jgi:hypothetical protein
MSLNYIVLELFFSRKEPKGNVLRGLLGPSVLLFCEAELTLFVSFSGNRRRSPNVIFYWIVLFPKRTKRGRSARLTESFSMLFCEAELTLFASFSGKRRMSSNVIYGKRTKRGRSARLTGTFIVLFCEAEQRFCFFSGKTRMWHNYRWVRSFCFIRKREGILIAMRD